MAIKTILDMLPSSVVSLAIQYLGFEKPLKAVFRMAGGVQAAKDLRKELDKMLIYRLQQTDMKDVMEELISRNDFLVSVLLVHFISLVSYLRAWLLELISVLNNHKYPGT